VTGFVKYGLDSENIREYGKNHIGEQVVLWKASPILVFIFLLTLNFLFKMKKIIILLLLLNNYVNFSQDLSIHLEIVEATEKNFLNIGFEKSKSFIETPYLNITYQNLSNKDIYFKKLDKCQKVECYPNALASKISTNFNDDLNKNIKKDKLNVYKVFLDAKPLYAETYFDIENAKTIEKQGKEYITIAPMRDIIEERFYTMVGIAQLQCLLKKYGQNVQLEYFKYKKRKNISVFEAEKWLLENNFVEIKNIDNVFINETHSIDISHIKDYFIFLKKGESYTEKINLIGLKLLGQNFEFDYRNLKFDNYEEKYNFNLKKMERYYLPKNVDGFVPLDKGFEIEFTPLKVKL